MAGSKGTAQERGSRDGVEQNLWGEGGGQEQRRVLQLKKHWFPRMNIRILWFCHLLSVEP